MATSSNSDSFLPKRVILVAVGGASCSGKTTLAKHLRRIIKGSFIIHQDDFAPPEKLVPIHPTLGIQDWDDPDGAIVWPKLIEFLRRAKREGGMPKDHQIHDSLNPQAEVPIPSEVLDNWSGKFDEIQEEARKGENGVEIVWGIVDGFLLYWHPEVVRELDIRLFLRESYGTLKARRQARFEYYTAVQFSPEGSLWIDPPNYWDDVVWPAYLKAHRNIFTNGDISRGEPVAHPAAENGHIINGAIQEGCLESGNGRADKEVLPHYGGPVSNLVVLPVEGMSMTALVVEACRHLTTYIGGRI